MIKEKMRKCFIKYCDYCGKEINDYSSTTLTHKINKTEKHFHSMYTIENKGITCLTLYEQKNKNKKVE